MNRIMIKMWEVDSVQGLGIDRLLRMSAQDMCQFMQDDMLLMRRCRILCIEDVVRAAACQPKPGYIGCQRPRFEVNLPPGMCRDQCTERLHVGDILQVNPRVQRVQALPAKRF